MQVGVSHLGGFVNTDGMLRSGPVRVAVTLPVETASLIPIYERRGDG